MHNNVRFVLRDEDIQVNIIRRVVGGDDPFKTTKNRQGTER